MKTMRYFAAAPALVLLAQLFAGSAGAVVVAYNETASGGSDPDLPDTADGPATEFVLDIGTNTVMGNASAGPLGAGPVDLDDMILTVQPGQQLVSATFEWLVNTGTEVQSLFSFVSDFDNVILVSSESTPDTQPLSMFNSVLPLGVGSYLLNQLSIAVLNDTAGNFDYLWTFEVSAVPLPPAAWLLLSGVLALVGFSRRRRES